MEQVAKHALRELTWILQEPLEKRSQTVWRVQKVKCHVFLAFITGWEDFWEINVFVPRSAWADNLQFKLLNSSCLFVSTDKSAEKVFLFLYRDKSESLCGIQSMFLSLGSLSSWSLWCMRGLSSRLRLCKRHCDSRQWILLEVVRWSYQTNVHCIQRQSTDNWWFLQLEFNKMLDFVACFVRVPSCKIVLGKPGFYLFPGLWRSSLWRLRSRVF